jgi:hypothetical protein
VSLGSGDSALGLGRFRTWGDSAVILPWLNPDLQAGRAPKMPEMNVGN